MAQVKVPRPARKAQEAPPSRTQIPHSLDQPASPETETLNFRVTTAFKRELKSYAAAQGLTMTDWLQEAYALYRKHHG
jgi:hypothetical protein